ncbi:hypothetical protein ABW20_dc0109456 [Dactylellina cionopaga]|nr:hypothetical protein ABW20_dc0109456 [Dactylellina cionopaga]
MGWFSALKNGIGAAVNFVQRNSGTIASAIETVSSVAKLLAVEYPEIWAQEHASYDAQAESDLHLSYDQADRYLVELSKAPAEELPETLANAGDRQTKSRGVSGVFSMPTPIDSAGRPTLTMYQDLAKFLGQYGIPPTLVTSSGPVDVAEVVGEAFFANEPPKNVDLTTNAADIVVKAPVNITNKSKSINIQGKHVYYSIPMGTASDTRSWHSAFYITLTTNSQGRAELENQRRKLTYLNTELTVSDGTTKAGLSWIVTTSVAWTTIPFALEYHEKLVQAFKKAYPGYTVQYNSVAAQRQTLKIQAPPGATPALVRQAVVDTATALLDPPKSLGFVGDVPSKMGLNLAADVPPSARPILPPIYVTNSTIVG